MMWYHLVVDLVSFILLFTLVGLSIHMRGYIPPCGLQVDYYVAAFSVTLSKTEISAYSYY